MKMVSVHGVNDIRVDEVERPEVGTRDVLLHIDACGICGTDLTYAKIGIQRAGGEPWPLGHEAAGTIVETGADVTDFVPGERVVINPMACDDNVIGNGGSEGAFANFLVIRDAVSGRHLLPIPDHLSAERAALIEPLSVALHGINRAALRPDDKVVVYGSGPIGLGAVFWLARRGMRDITVVDLSDARLERARQLGAHHVINPANEDLRAALVRVHGEGAPVQSAPCVDTDIFLDMAGAATLLQQTTGFGKLHARIILTAVYPAPVLLDLQQMLLREIEIFPAIGYPDEFPEVLEVLAEPGLSLDFYVSNRFPFTEFPEAFAAAADRNSGKVMVLFD